MRYGQPDPKYTALHHAKQNLVSQIGRLIEPSFDHRELADAIEQLIDAKLAAVADRRY